MTRLEQLLDAIITPPNMEDICDAEAIRVRRLEILQQFVDEITPPPDYRKERDNERLMFMTSVIASGIAGREGAASSIAGRALEIASAIMSRVSSR